MIETKEQIYGRNDMVMLDKHNKIYGSLGIAEQYVFNTAEGNPAILRSPIAGKAEDVITQFEMQGWTEQNSTTGAQLFDKNTVDTGKYVADTSGNIHDGSSGKETSASDYILVSGLDYICATVTSYMQWMAFYNTEKTYISGVNGYASPIAVPDGAVYARFTVSNDYIDSFMVNAGRTLLPYEPYTGGKPSPSQDYPQEIVNAGSWNEDTQKWECEISVGGAQLFDISKVITAEGVVINNGDGTLTVKTIAVSSGVAAKSPNRLRDYCPDIVSGKTYYLYADSTGSEKFIYFGKSSSSWYFGSSRIITDDDLDSIVYFYASGLSTEATVSNIMSTEVSNAPYEQYKPPQTVTLTADRPLTKWDKLEKRNGQWGWVYKSAEIKSYTDESVPGEYYSTTGQLSVGAQVWYETATETFVPLSPEEQEQMNELTMNVPTTVISNNVKANMKITYKATQT